MTIWNAYAEYEDGTIIDKNFTNYCSNNTYEDECDYPYYLEDWLINQHQNITFYSINLIDSNLLTIWMLNTNNIY